MDDLAADSALWHSAQGWQRAHVRAGPTISGHASQEVDDASIQSTTLADA